MTRMREQKVNCLLGEAATRRSTQWPPRSRARTRSSSFGGRAVSGAPTGVLSGAGVAGVAM